MYTEKLVMQKWPTAEALRREDRACPNCKRRGEFVTFTLPSVTEVDGVEENCGCLCGFCGWGNATSRDIQEGAT